MFDKLQFVDDLKIESLDDIDKSVPDSSKRGPDFFISVVSIRIANRFHLCDHQLQLLVFSVKVR